MIARSPRPKNKFPSWTTNVYRARSTVTSSRRGSPLSSYPDYVETTRQSRHSSWWSSNSAYWRCLLGILLTTFSWVRFCGLASRRTNVIRVYKYFILNYYHRLRFCQVYKFTAQVFAFLILPRILLLVTPTSIVLVLFRVEGGNGGDMLVETVEKSWK